MNILIISYYASWSSSVGSRRMGGLIKALASDGHAITVIGSAPPDRHRPPPTKGVQLIETPPTDRYLSARAAVTRVRHLGRRAPAGGSDIEPVATTGPAMKSPAPSGRVASSARNVARRWIGFPDTMWEWTSTAQRAAAQLSVRPDLVIASAPPMAALHAASKIASEASCPWIADMRDLWTGDPNRHTPLVLRPIDRRLERRVLSSAAAVTTVAESLADDLRRLAPAVPVVALRNGFDDRWLRLGDEPPNEPPTVVFTGTLTSNTGRSLDELCDVAAELQVMRRNGSRTPTIEIYGALDPSIPALLATRSVGDVIRLNGVVSAETTRQAQHQASALLSLSWESPRDYTNLPAKLFEYAAAKRPVLHLGRVETLGTRLIADHRLGFVADPSDAATVAKLVQAIVDGETPWVAPPTESLRPLSQSAMLDGFRAVIERVFSDVSG
jgi:glycosyltransferase involved in cell wall biosynthesis